LQESNADKKVKKNSNLEGFINGVYKILLISAIIEYKKFSFISQTIL